MKIKIMGLFVFAFFVLSNTCYAKEGTLSDFFKKSDLDMRITQMKSALQSFKSLSNLIYLKSNLKKDYKISTMDESKIPVKAQIRVLMTGAELKKIGNQGWEIQNIGFANWPKYVEGYIEYMELENLQLKLQLAEKSKLGSDVIKKLSDSINKKEANIKKKYLSEENWTD